MRILSIRLEADSGSPTDGHFLCGQVTTRMDGHESPSSTSWNASQSVIDSMDELLASLRSGQLTPSQAGVLSEHLRMMLPDKELSLVGDSIGVLATSTSGDARFLTNVPWELLPRASVPSSPTPGEIVDSTVGGLAMARLVDGEAFSPDPVGRPRILFAVANPEDGDLPCVEVARFQHAFEQALTCVAAYDIRRQRCDPTELTATRLRLEINDVAPHVLILVAHGSSGNEIGDPSVVHLCEGPLQVATLAGWLRDTSQTCLAVLLCCDLVASPNGNVASTGAARIVREGVPQVVAMQGAIDQGIASRYLQSLLASMLMRPDLPAAARDARQSIKAHAQAVLPTVFQNVAVCSEPSRLAARVDALAEAKITARAELSWHPPTIPREVESLLFKRMSSTGLLIVTGPQHCGKSVTVCRAALDMLDARSPFRPVIRVKAADHSKLALVALAKEFEAVFDQHESLLPRVRQRSSAGNTAADLATAVDDLAVTVILELNERIQRGAWFVPLLKRLAQNRQSLVVVTCRMPPDVPNVEPIVMSYFSVPEVRTYLEKHVPELAEQAEDVQQLTGGHPLLLDALAVRKIRRRTVALADVEQIAHARATHALAAEIVEAVEEWSVDGAHADGVRDPLAALEILTRLEVPVSVVGLISDHLPIATHEESTYAFLSYLESLGAVRRLGDLPTELLVFTPLLRSAVATALQPRAADASRLLVEHLDAKIPDADHLPWIQGVFATDGGGAILAELQSALLDETINDRPQWEKAYAVVVTVDDGRSSPLLPQMYGRLTVSQAPKRMRRRSLIRQGRLSHAIRDLRTAQKCVTTLRRLALDSADRAEMLLLSANVRKSRDQHRGAQTALDELQEARALITEGAQEVEGVDALDLLCEVIQAEVNVRMFLLGNTADEIAPLVDLLRQIAPRDEISGEALSTLSEHRRRGAETDAQWTEVCECAVEGYSRTRDSTNDTRRAYCTYQYAKYLHRATVPSLHEAVRLYGECAEEARRAGDWSRYALAEYNRTMIQTGHPQEIEPRQGANRLDKVLRDHSGPLSSSDSLTLRAFERVCTLRADLAWRHGLDGGLTYAMDACRATLGLPTKSETDVHRFRETVVKVLNAFEELGALVDAQRFVRVIKGFLKERLGVKASITDPWRLASDLAADGTQLGRI